MCWQTKAIGVWLTANHLSYMMNFERYCGVYHFVSSLSYFCTVKKLSTQVQPKKPITNPMRRITLRTLRETKAKYSGSNEDPCVETNTSSGNASRASVVYLAVGGACCHGDVAPLGRGISTDRQSCLVILFTMYTAPTVVTGKLQFR